MSASTHHDTGLAHVTPSSAPMLFAIPSHVSHCRPVMVSNGIVESTWTICAPRPTGRTSRISTSASGSSS